MKDTIAIIAAALFLGAVCAVMVVYKAQAKHQPIAYNHKKHIDNGLECGFCHTGIAEGKARALLPSIDICLGCHSEDDNPKTKPIRDFAEKKKPIPWQRVYQAPDDVYFTHRRHVASAKLDCSVCHGNVKEMEMPISRRAVSISMGRCMNCHRSRGVTNDCLACHR